MFRKCISSVLIIQFLYPKVTPFVSKISLPLQLNREEPLRRLRGTSPSLGRQRAACRDLSFPCVLTDSVSAAFFLGVNGSFPCVLTDSCHDIHRVLGHHEMMLADLFAAGRADWVMSSWYPLRAA